MSIFEPKLDPSVLFGQLKLLAQTRPQSLQAVDDRGRSKQEVLQWLGQLHALVEAGGNLTDAITLRMKSADLTKTVRDQGHFAEIEIWAIFERALAKAELFLPSHAQGGFFPVGGHLDTFAMLAKVLGNATRDVLVVDPYLDGVAVTDFLVLVPEGVSIRLLSDGASLKPTLKPAIQRWAAQYGDRRPLTARATSPRQLHDRLIILDNVDVWIITQSFKDFAARSPGSIEKANAESSALKVEAYSGIWENAESI